MSMNTPQPKAGECICREGSSCQAPHMAQHVRLGVISGPGLPWELVWMSH